MVDHAGVPPQPKMHALLEMAVKTASALCASGPGRMSSPEGGPLKLKSFRAAHVCTVCAETLAQQIETANVAAKRAGASGRLRLREARGPETQLPRGRRLH